MKNNSMTINQNFNLINAKYKLTNLEMKFILDAISQLDSKNDKILQEYEIKVSEFEKKMKIGEGQHTRLKQFAKRLMSKPILIEQNNGDFEVFNWFSKIRYINNEAKFLVRFEESLKPYLLELKERFVSYNLKYILPLSSTYSIRIYQLLKEYEKLKKRYFIVDDLQDILQVPKSYKNYAKFKQGILKVAERELKEHCDIYFTIEEEKTGRKVTRIIFSIYKNNYQKEVEKAIIADKEKVTDYTNLYGMNCKLNGKICEHLLLIQKLKDGTLNCTFRSGEYFNIKNTLQLLKSKI